jgi:hypothetical protein
MFDPQGPVHSFLAPLILVANLALSFHGYSSLLDIVLQWSSLPPSLYVYWLWGGPSSSVCDAVFFNGRFSVSIHDKYINSVKELQYS